MPPRRKVRSSSAVLLTGRCCRTPHFGQISARAWICPPHASQTFWFEVNCAPGGAYRFAAGVIFSPLGSCSCHRPSRAISGCFSRESLSARSSAAGESFTAREENRANLVYLCRSVRFVEPSNWVKERVTDWGGHGEKKTPAPKLCYVVGAHIVRTEM